MLLDAILDTSCIQHVIDKIISDSDTCPSEQREKMVLGVAVSGGADSLALCHLLSTYVSSICASDASAPSGAEVQPEIKPEIMALTVDHGLRSEAAQEARNVHDIVQEWPCIDHHILTWNGDKPESRIQEKARHIRYSLFKEFCGKYGITHLFIAHHQDDQAETFLFRLAKGSGLDGLSCMHPVSPLTEKTDIIRPFLNIPKCRIIQYCDDHNIAYMNDPTNCNLDHARPRLRAAKQVLAEEGLTPKRLSQTARRMARARSALQHISAQAFETLISRYENHGVSARLVDFQNLPEEIAIRVFIQIMQGVNPHMRDGYGPRFEAIENVVYAIMYDRKMKRQTLGGCLITVSIKRGLLIVEPENGTSDQQS